MSKWKYIYIYLIWIERIFRKKNAFFLDILKQTKILFQYFKLAAFWYIDQCKWKAKTNKKKTIISFLCIEYCPKLCPKSTFYTYFLFVCLYVRCLAVQCCQFNKRTHFETHMHKSHQCTTNSDVLKTALNSLTSRKYIFLRFLFFCQIPPSVTPRLPTRLCVCMRVNIMLSLMKQKTKTTI